jgi:hypothetical protein
MEKQSTNVCVAVSALIATLFSLGLGVAVGLVRQHPMPGIVITSNGTIMTVGFFALPLVWWRYKVGYVCAIAVGLVNVIGDILAIASGLPFAEGMPQGTIAIIVSQIIVSVLVIVYCLRSWREP